MQRTSYTALLQRPQFWSGVDAQEFQDGQIEIDWIWIDNVIDNGGAMPSKPITKRYLQSYA